MEKQSSSNFKKASAFLNVRIKDANGQMRQLKGIPLHADKHLDGSIMNLTDETLASLVAEGRVELKVVAVDDSPVSF